MQTNNDDTSYMNHVVQEESSAWTGNRSFDPGPCYCQCPAHLSDNIYNSTIVLPSTCYIQSHSNGVTVVTTTIVSTQSILSNSRITFM